MIQKKVNLRRLLCAVLMASVLFVGMEGLFIEAYAAEDGSSTSKVDVIEATLMEMPQDVRVNPNTRTVLASCTITYGMSSSGLHVEITTACANGSASSLGVKDVKIQKKVWWGWDTIATSSGGQDTNCHEVGIQFDYAGVEVGQTYRISCVHYGTYDVYTDLYNETSAFEFRY